MRAWLQNLFSNDDEQISALHVCLVFIVGLCGLLLFDVAALAVVAFILHTPFATITTSLGTFIRDFGTGLGLIFAAVGSAWWMKK